MNRMQPFHLPEVLDMLAEMHAFSPHFSANHVADAAHVEKQLSALMYAPGFISVIEAGDKKDLAGVMLGAVSHSWYSPTLEACEMVLYLRPEYRRGSRAMRMIKSFEAQAVAMGAKVIHAGTSAGNNDEGVIRLYQRLGYHRTVGGVRKLV